MNEDIQQLEQEREQLYKQVLAFDDFRLGTISETHTRCGKKNCACADKKNHPGHQRYLWNTTRQGKSVAQHVRFGPELEHVQEQIEEGHRFQKWCQEILQVNEKICRLRPVPEVESTNELTVLKKKLQKKSSRKRTRRSKV